MNRIWHWSVSRWNLPRWRRRLQGYLTHPGYLPLVCLISAVNGFIPFFPLEVFLILRVLVQPKDWWRVSLMAAVASGISAAGLAHLLAFQPHASLTAWLSSRLGEESWEQVSQFIREKGAFGLGLISVSFLPLPPAVLVCALSKVPEWQIALAISSGNSLKYGFFSWLAARSPRWFGDPEQDYAASP